MKNIEIFEHTADTGIRLSRPTRETLFRDSAFGMFHIIAPGNIFHPKIEYSVAVDGADDEELMVNWLSELNFYFQTEQYVPVEINIQFDKDKVIAHIKGDVLKQSIHTVETEIKAVTYHKIYVKQNNKWHTQVIFDI